MLETTGPSPACSVCTWVWVTLNGVVTLTRGAVVSVDPVTATLPVVPARVQSGAPPLCGAAVGHDPAAFAVPGPASSRTVAAALAASATDEDMRKEFTAVTLQRRVGSPTDRPGWDRPSSRVACRFVCCCFDLRDHQLAGEVLSVTGLHRSDHIYRLQYLDKICETWEFTIRQMCNNIDTWDPCQPVRKLSTGERLPSAPFSVV